MAEEVKDTGLWGSSPMSIGIQQSLRTLFSAILIGGIDRDKDTELLNKKVVVAQECRSRFVADFPFNVFNDNYAIFYEIIVTLQVNTFTKDQLISIIENNRDLILDSPYIDKAKYSRTLTGTLANDDDIIEAITADLVDDLETLSYNYVTVDDYKSSANTYVDWYKNALAHYTALKMTSIMSETGLDLKLPGKRNRHYHGLSDFREFYNHHVRIIDSLSEENKIKSTILDTSWLEEELQQDAKQDTDSILDTGIHEIDDVNGEMRRGNFIGILGPPKGGKTRFTNHLVRRALAKGLNVAVWPLEGTKDEWISMQTACLIANLSKQKVASGSQSEMVLISSRDILQKKYINSPQMRELVAAAKATIANGPQYGRLSFIEGTCYVEDMLSILQDHYDNDNPFDVLVIDQLINVMSRTGKGKVERISEAYMLTKDFLANKLSRPALGIMPSQIKQEVVDMLRRSPDADIDVTAGGECAETIRTPDAVIGLFSSKEERANNMMKIYSVASRHSASFENFSARCYLGCCYFASQDDGA